MSGPVRIVLVDDDPLVRAGLGMILGGDPELSVIGEASDGREGVDLVLRERPDVVLMDIRMPVLDGLSATEELLATENPPRIIVLTTLHSDEMVVRALGAGAAGFLLKDTAPAQMVAAIKAAAAGEPALSPQITAQLIATATSADRRADDHAAESARAQLAALTERELDVARGVGQGRSNAEIAAELYLSLATVKAHVGRALAKLGLENRVQLALLVRDASHP